MSVTAGRLAAFREDIGTIPCHDDAKLLQAKSRDYYWYSPILKERLDRCSGQLLVRPRTEDEVRTIAGSVARHRIPLTVRGGGTGNYGQCVPIEGGVILETTGLSAIREIADGRVICEAGARIGHVESAVAGTGQMLTMFPSTRRIATMGGFVAGGSGGIGSLRHGMLRDGGNIAYLRIVTVEETPRIIELRGKDILKAQHAYGTNGIITAMDYALAPATDWIHAIALFDGYPVALRFAGPAQKTGLDAFLLTVVERRFARFYRRLADRFPDRRDAVFSMVAPDAMADFRACVAEFGGTVSLAKSSSGMEAANLPPAWECGWNHTTLQALKLEPGSWTYLQVAYPRPFDPDLVARQRERYGDEIYFHHELARMDGVSADPRVNAYRVTFQPGARTAWHLHSGTQLLLVVEGRCRVQKAGEAVQEVETGGVIRIEAGERHWHGASAHSPMTHVALNLDAATTWFLSLIPI